MVAALEAAGITADRVYFLVGAAGAKALRDTKGFFSVFDDVMPGPLLSTMVSGAELPWSCNCSKLSRPDQ